MKEITDKIIPEIREWQKRQLEEQYAIVFVDATYFNVKQDGIVVKVEINDKGIFVDNEQVEEKDTETKKFKQAAGEPDKRVRRLYGSVYELYFSELRCGIRRIPD